MLGILGAVTAVLCLAVANAKVVEHYFNVTWVMANPDGLFERQVVGINGSWPLPVIDVDMGDRLIVHMHNGLGDLSTSIHFHGMFQNGTTDMDGASMVTQCPVPPGSEMTYNFTVNQPGTYWYHCHVDYCYPDGYRQALLVHNDGAWFQDQVEGEFAITLSDWYHELASDIAPSFLSVYNPTGAEPVPNSFLFNDTLNSSLSVLPNKTYRLRIINISAFVAQYFYIEGHDFTVVEIDGVYTEPAKASVLYLGVAQRYSILVNTTNSTATNWPIVTVADSVLLDAIPSDLQLNYTNWLQYNASAPHPQADIKVAQSSDLVPFDDITLIPYDHMPLLPEPDHVIEVTVVMENLENGDGYAFLNNISYTKPKVPTLYSVMSSGKLATNDIIYGEYTNPVVLKHNDVVQIVLNNNDTGSHPFHLHGHNFQLLERSPPLGKNFYKDANIDPVPFDSANHTPFPAIPARRDTFILPPNGHWVVRFVADNPGVWFFHCHIDWHLAQGLGMLMVEAPTQMQERLSIPQNHYDVCEAAGVQSKGNAAGDVQDFTDLNGQNAQVGWIAAGFTARGIVALVFSCINAVLGLGFIMLYGVREPKVKKDGKMIIRDGWSSEDTPNEEEKDVSDSSATKA